MALTLKFKVVINCKDQEVKRYLQIRANQFAQTIAQDGYFVEKRAYLSYKETLTKEFYLVMFDSFFNNNTGECFKIDALPNYQFNLLSEVSHG